MVRTTTMRRPWVPPAVRVEGQGDERQPDVDSIRADLATLADQLGALWSAALELGEFDEVTHLVDASHAVHRALVALEATPQPPWELR